LKQELRSNRVNNPMRRAQWLALGITDEDMLKPKIAVVNSSSELAICFSHLDGIAAVVKQAVRAAGGLPFEIRTVAPSDFIINSARGGNYILPSRDLLTNDIEVAVEGAQLDGMICLASCDKTMPGQVMAAARLNIPSIIVICGYQQSGALGGRHCDIEDVFLGSAHAAMGRITPEALKEMSANAIRGPGVCSGLGTANTMHSVSEALGMSLPGAAPVRASSAKMMDYARQSGSRIVEMVWEDLRPRSILTPAAFANAVAMVLGISGSINSIKHLQAIAVEGEVDVDIYRLFDEMGRRVPVVCAIRPNGDYPIEAFEDAGGARAVMKSLESLLQTEALTVTGRTVSENLRDVTVADAEVIRSLGLPYSKQPAIVLLRGSLAQNGVVKIGLGSEGRPTQFRGPAKVFEDRQTALEAIRTGSIRAGDVLVLRGDGVKGGPGMGGAANMAVFALDGVGLALHVAVVTDGQMSGLANKGLVVAEVEPEGGVAGPLSVVQDGDTISIDLGQRRLDLDIAETDLRARLADAHVVRRPDGRGWLSIYRRTALPLSDGAALVPKADFRTGN
jgi:dihydroxy-acid dehydratase